MVFKCKVALLAALFFPLVAFARVVEEDEQQVMTRPALSSRATAPSLSIAIQAGHIHILRQSRLTFTVTDDATKQGVAGLKPDIYFHSTHEDEMIGVWASSASTGKPVVDAGGGKYTWDVVLPRLETYYILFAFESGGAWYLQHFHVETSLAGHESYFRPSLQNATYNYQLRWKMTWNTPVSYPAATSEVTFTFEPRRTFGSVTLDRPWTNKFNHLRDTDVTNLTVAVASKDGQIREVLPVTYLGMGQYKVSRVFLPSEVSAQGRWYVLQISFVDSDGFVIDTAAEGTSNYEFWVAPVP